MKKDISSIDCHHRYHIILINFLTIVLTIAFDSSRTLPNYVTINRAVS